MDCSVVKTKLPDTYLISTTDYFFPLVDDPYMQGRIAACNVLSDMYAMGVVDIDTMLMILGVSVDMDDKEKDVVTTEMIRGFNDLAKEAGTTVTGGQTTMNQWPLIGGVATSICKEGVDFLRPIYAIPGDVLVLTKPLGMQLIVNGFEWTHNGKYETVSDKITKEEIMEAYEKGCKSMSRLNRTGALLMHKYHSHACTDVTGFGIIGHANNLASTQNEKVTFEIHTMPVVRNMLKIAAISPGYNFVKGRAAETSGGLLIAMSENDAKGFIKEIEEIDHCPAWIVGRVIEGDNTARLVDDVEFLEV